MADCIQIFFTSVRGKLEMEFPKDLGGSSFRWIR